MDWIWGPLHDGRISWTLSTSMNIKPKHEPSFLCVYTIVPGGWDAELEYTILGGDHRELSHLPGGPGPC